MTLNSIEPNAHYDLVHGKPSVFEKDNDGSFLFRFNIEPEMGALDGETEVVQIGWKCREIRIWDKPTKQVLKKEIIRSALDETEEFSLINSYNKHVLGIKEDSDALGRYVAHLSFTEDVEALLVNNFQNETF